MYSLFNFIKIFVNQYTSFSYFYIQELSMYISKFEFINCIILISIFLFLGIRFLIIHYTFKKLIYFFLKRIFFTFFYLFIFNFFLNPIYCDNQINKIFDTNTKKVCIATIVITGCYLSYKYIPLYYKTVKSHTEYIQYLKKKEIYDKELKIYEEENFIYLQSLDKVKQQKNLLIEYNSNKKFFIDFLVNMDQNFKNIFKYDKFDLFFTNNQVLMANTLINNIKNPGSKINEYDKILFNIKNNILQSSFKIEDLLNNSGKIYKISDSFIINQKNCFKDFNKLQDFYELKLIPTIKNFTVNNNFNLTLENLVIINDLIIDYDNLLNNCLKSSNLMLSQFSKIKNSDLLIEPFLGVVTPNVCDYKKPVDLDPINFPLENLEGVRYIGINIGYVVFYPVLYTSNKIFGTCNPLSNKAFIEAVSYLINIIKFF